MEKLVLMVTHGPEDAERATIPFVFATAAQASDVEVVMGFQASGVLLLLPGVAERVLAPEFPPLKELIETFVEAGGTMFACGPCVKARQIDPQEFISGTRVVNAGTFIQQFTEATNVLVY